MPLLTSCTFDSSPAGSENNQSPSTLAPTIITFGAYDFERKQYESLMQIFNRANSDVQVQFVSLDEVVRNVTNEQFDFDKLTRRIVSAADTFTIDGVPIEAVKSGYFRDLKPLIDADPRFDLTDFYTGTFDIFSQGNGIYGIPRTRTIPILKYNRDLFIARGIPTPKSDWTWHDLTAINEQLAQMDKKGSETYGMIENSHGVLPLLIELTENGINISETSLDTLHLDDPKFIAAFKHMALLVQSGAIYIESSKPENAANNNSQKLIIEGRIGMWQADLFRSSANQQPSFRTGTVLLPLPPEIDPLIFSAQQQGYAMSGGTKYPEAAWRWLSFLSRQLLPQSGQVTPKNQSSELPARRSLAEQGGYWKNLDDEMKDAINTALNRPAHLPTAHLLSSGGSAAIEVLYEAMQAVADDIDPIKALRQAQIRLNQITETPTVMAETGPIVVSTPVPLPSDEGRVTIKFGVLGGDLEQVRKVVENFNQNNPDVFVTLNEDAQAGLNGFEQMASTNDCFVRFGSRGSSEITATLDLQPLIDADAVFSPNDIPSNFFTPFKRGNSLYGLPYMVTFNTLSYNQTAYDAAGLPYPTINWTPDDLLHAAQRLTSGEGENKQYGFAAPGDQTQSLAFFLDRFGTSLTTGRGKDAIPNFTDPKTIQSMKFFIDLLRNYSPHKNLESYTPGPGTTPITTDLIQQGRVGMWLNLDNFNFYSGSKPKFVTAVAPLPLGGSRLSPRDFYVAGLYISAKTSQVQACWTWLKTLINIPTVPVRHGQEGQNTFPVRKSVTTSEAFKQQAITGASEVYMAYTAAMNSVPEASSSEIGSKDESDIDYYWFYRAVDRALQGKDLTQELAEAQDLTEQYSACVRSGGDKASCATLIDSTYKGFAQPAPNK